MDAKDRKLGELILYIAERSECDLAFGAIKLNKILFYSDFTMYWRRRESITGQEYMKLENGPAPRRLLAVQQRLIEKGRAALKTTSYFGHSQKRMVALAEPDLSVFVAEEIAQVDRILDALSDLNGRQASELSHRFVGWKAAAEKETIPYSTVFISDRELTASEEEHGLKVAERLASAL